MSISSPSLSLFDHVSQSPPFQEARERLKYCADARTAGLLTGPAGVGKSRLLADLAEELNLDGCHVASLDARGWQAGELSLRLAVKLGLSHSLDLTQLNAWTRLEQWAESLRKLNHRHVLVFDHLERCGESAIAWDRLLGMLAGVVPVLFAHTPPAQAALQSVIHRHCPLRITLGRLSAGELRSMSSTRHDVPACSPNAILALQELSAGRLRSAERLLQLAIHAAEDDDSGLVHEQLIRSAAHEVRL